MDRIWQWTWDRFGPRYYWWALCVIGGLCSLPIYLSLVSLPIVAFEESDRYLEATAITVVAVVVLVGVMALPDGQWGGLVKRWAAGHDVDRKTVLEATYSYTRRSSSR